MAKNVFYFILKAFFFLKMFKLLSWLFGHGEKTALLKKDKIVIWKLWRHNLANEQL